MQQFMKRILLFAALAGCNTPVVNQASNNPGNFTGGGTSATVGKTSVSFLTNIQPILDKSCTSCHTTSQQGDYTKGRAYESLVNVKSTLDQNQVLVRPGDSLNSLLFLKISQRQPPAGAPMPPNSPLSDQEIQLIKTWIDEGAPNN